MRKPGSILGRLTLWYACSAFGVILVSTAALYGALVANLNREDQEFVADIVDIVREFLRDRPEDVAGLKQTVEWEWSGRQYADIYVRVLDQRGRAVAETPRMAERLGPRLFPTPVAVDADPGPGIQIALPGSRSFRAVSAMALVGRTRGETRVIQTAIDQAHEAGLLAEYRKRLWWVLSVALVACTVVGHAIARRGVRPLAEITEAARRIRSSTLDSRISIGGLPRELLALAETFNTMLVGLEDSFGRLSRFSADIAHELGRRKQPARRSRGGPSPSPDARGIPKCPRIVARGIGAALSDDRQSSLRGAGRESRDASLLRAVERRPRARGRQGVL